MSAARNLHFYLATVLSFSHNLPATFNDLLVGTAIIALAYRSWIVRKSADEVGVTTPE